MIVKKPLKYRTHCPFCGNKKPSYEYGTVCCHYNCKCGASTRLLRTPRPKGFIGMWYGTRTWVKE